MNRGREEASGEERGRGWGKEEGRESPAEGQEVREPRLKRPNRQQLLLRTVDVEELIPEDHAARAIWAFVERLDLSGFEESIKAVEGMAGRSAWDPQLLISLWIYAYSEGVSSAREMERLCRHHPGYQWLTGMEVINYHTLSDFRVEHQEALDELFTQVLGLLSAEGLITLERVMQDGTKVKACAGGDTFRREEKIRAHLELAREQVRQMGDPRGEEVSHRVAKARERAAREKEEKLEQALAELEKIRGVKGRRAAKEEARVSETDPEARMMKQADGGYAPSYNLQLSTEAAHGLVVGVGVSQASSDYGELVGAVEEMEKNLGRVPPQVVADGGYTSRENILAMEEKRVDFLGPLPESASSPGAASLKRRGVDPAFYPEAFGYDPTRNELICPAGKRLVEIGKKHDRVGITRHVYRARGADCQACPSGQKCCPQNPAQGRTVGRGVEDPVVAAFRAKMQREEAKQIYRQRGGVAEFPNAWLKDKIGLRQFRLRGLIKVRMEALWACLTYNLQQWIRLRWRVQPTLSTA